MLNIIQIYHYAYKIPDCCICVIVRVENNSKINNFFLESASNNRTESVIFQLAFTSQGCVIDKALSKAIRVNGNV